MKKIILFVLATLLSATGCLRNEEELEIPTRGSTSLTARMEYQVETKTVLSEQIDGMYYPLWSERDSLSVFTSPGQQPTLFTLSSGAGETTAIFEGPLLGDRYVALFPYDSKASWTDNSLSFIIPERQVYRPNSFSLDGFPMLAMSETGDLTFKNLCSIIHLAITGSAVIGSITLHSNNNYLSGPATVNLAYEDSPSLEMKEGGSHYVRLDCSAVMLVPETPQDFYIVIPSGIYDGLDITIDTYTDKITKSIPHEIKMSRSELRSVSPFVLDAPMIDLDNLPDNQVWYKTRSGTACTFEGNAYPPFDVDIVFNSYAGDYGIIVFEQPLKKLNQYAFAMSDITELHLPDSVEEIERWALPHLPVLRVPRGIKKLGEGALSTIESVYGPPIAEDGRSVIYEETLLGVVDEGLEDYVTPPGVRLVGEYCFMGTHFKTITFSEGVSRIEEQALMYAYVEKVYIPESVVWIGRQTTIYDVKGFYGNSLCTSEDHLCLINPNGYYGPDLVGLAVDDQLEVFTIPEGVSTISTFFYDWPNLRTIRIPESLSWFAHLGLVIDLPRFEGFEGPNVTSDGRCLIKNGVVMAVYGVGIKDYTIPPGAHMIQMSSMFALGRGDIENLTISEGVEVLNQYSLECCPKLKTVTLPTTIKTISYNVFSEDDNLESVFLPVRIPPAVWGGPGGSEIRSNLKVYVPEESFDAYMADPTWKGLWEHYLTPYKFETIDPPTPYASNNYSLDGKVTVLQKASVGNGIDLVLMGDAFSDRMIEDSRYLAAMEKIESAFFAIEPYHSFRHLFNVYAVNVVSPSEDYLSGDLALEMQIYPDGTVTANADKCIEYALKAIPDANLDEATIIVVGNTFGMDPSQMSGMCYMMNRSEPTTDYGTGLGLALFSYPYGQNLIQHEAGGHGFGKLCDEYSSRSEGIDMEIQSDEVDLMKSQQKAGWWKNVDFTSDPSKVRWSHFLSDARYEKEYLGVYEGAGMFYSRGIYRPSEDGMMNSGYNSFNAPSREAIYYRIHKLAYGPEWEYNYEDFVKWDQGAKNIHPTATPQSVSGKKTYEVREPLPSKPFNPDEWTVTVMK